MTLVVEIWIEIGIQKYANLYMNIQTKKMYKTKKEDIARLFFGKACFKRFFHCGFVYCVTKQIFIS